MKSLTIAKYPFLLGKSDRLAAEYDVGIDNLISSEEFSEARKRGVERVLDAVKKSEVSNAKSVDEDALLIEILSYPYARILVSAINDNFLTRKYALAESVRVVRLLGREVPFISHIMAGILDVKTTMKKKGLEMYFADYLRHTARIKESEWRLVNNEVFSGYVWLERGKFDRVLQNTLQDMIESELPIAVPDEIVQAVSKDVEQIPRVLKKEKDMMRQRFSGKLEDSELPPCIKTLLADANEGINLSHSGRFAVVSFLRSIGMDAEQILAVFSESPDFDKDRSAYQIKHITGELNGTEGYAAPGCGAMKTNGLCPDPDDLCINRKISHPLNYYRLKTIKKK